MAVIIDIHRDLHAANVRRIARRILATFGSHARDCDIAESIHHPIPGLNNWFTIKFLINRYFPAPSLCHVRDPEGVEMLVISKLLASIREPLLPSDGEQERALPPQNG